MPEEDTNLVLFHGDDLILTTIWILAGGQPPKH